MTDPGLGETATKWLKTQQSSINAIPDFEGRQVAAYKAWEQRNSAEGAATFEEVKARLKAMAIGQKFCNYCEHNLILKSTIEHVRPKIAFPEYVFVWDNMLGACENCNMGHKKASMYVFDPVGSANSVKIGRGMPPSDDLAFVHPRQEDGLEFMEMSFVDFQFYPLRAHQPASRNYWKCQRTIEVLRLNDPDLVTARADFFHYYRECLREYCRVLAAHTHDELREAVAGRPPILDTEDVESQKRALLNAIRRSFTNKPHQTVWREMQRRAHELLPAEQELFLASGAASW